MATKQSINLPNFNNAVSAFKNGEIQKAYLILKNIVMTSPKHHEALNLLAIISMQKNSFKHAVKY